MVKRTQQSVPQDTAAPIRPLHQAAYAIRFLIWHNSSVPEVGWDEHGPRLSREHYSTIALQSYDISTRSAKQIEENLTFFRQRTRYIILHHATPCHMEMFNLAWNNVCKARNGVSLCQCDISNTVNSHDKTVLKHHVNVNFLLLRAICRLFTLDSEGNSTSLGISCSEARGCGRAHSAGFHYPTSPVLVQHTMKAAWRKLYYTKTDSKAGLAIHQTELREQGGGVIPVLEQICVIIFTEILKMPAALPMRREPEFKLSSIFRPELFISGT